MMQPELEKIRETSSPWPDDILFNPCSKSSLLFAICKFEVDVQKVKPLLIDFQVESSKSSPLNVALL